MVSERRMLGRDSDGHSGVRVEGENINRAIDQLQRKMANEGIYKELKKRRFYEKPSERRSAKCVKQSVC